MRTVKRITINLFVVSLLFTLPGCMADMRTTLIKKEGITELHVSKGKTLLEAAWKKHGFDSMAFHQTYSFNGTDTWKGMMGKMGKPWPDAISEIEFKYVIGTFDSQLKFKTGKRKGVLAGLQSWNYYEKEPEGELTFKPYDKRIGFGLSAYQYFLELPGRLKKAPLISYAGEKVFNENHYDLVFVTWEKPEPHMEHDQYLLWINKKTGMLDYAVYSLRDNFLKMPGYKAFYGSIYFSDFVEVEGVLIPHKQTVYLNSPSQNPEKYIHQMIVTDFQFDNFNAQELYPNPEIKSIGDAKSAIVK
ncbi:MAG: DUF6503 family protein [Bacteroidia bacterium]|nr:DUF6503 family protein [Bacteroidia bacterium]